jgi:hypothetical protein
MALRSLIGRRRYEHWTGEGNRYIALRRERAKRYDISESGNYRRFGNRAVVK